MTWDQHLLFFRMVLDISGCNSGRKEFLIFWYGCVGGWANFHGGKKRHSPVMSVLFQLCQLEWLEVWVFLIKQLYWSLGRSIGTFGSSSYYLLKARRGLVFHVLSLATCNIFIVLLYENTQQPLSRISLHTTVLFHLSHPKCLIHPFKITVGIHHFIFFVFCYVQIYFRDRL